jgi:probable phosphoglycerate mutase
VPSDHLNPLHLTLMRHGESTWNETRTIQGQMEGAVLTPKGRDQVARAAESLVGTPFDRIVSSDMTRALGSAKIVAELLGLDVGVDLGLRERSFGALEGGTADALTPRLSGICDGRVVDDAARPIGGESLMQLLMRADAFVKRTREDYAGQRLLVITHGGTIRAIRALCAGTNFEGTEWYPVANASLWPMDL